MSEREKVGGICGITTATTATESSVIRGAADGPAGLKWRWDGVRWSPDFGELYIVPKRPNS